MKKLATFAMAVVLGVATLLSGCSQKDKEIEHRTFQYDGDVFWGGEEYDTVFYGKDTHHLYAILSEVRLDKNKEYSLREVDNIAHLVEPNIGTSSCVSYEVMETPDYYDIMIWYEGFFEKDNVEDAIKNDIIIVSNSNDVLMATPDLSSSDGEEPVEKEHNTILDWDSVDFFDGDSICDGYIKDGYTEIVADDSKNIQLDHVSEDANLVNTEEYQNAVTCDYTLEMYYNDHPKEYANFWMSETKDMLPTCSGNEVILQYKYTEYAAEELDLNDQAIQDECNGFKEGVQEDFDNILKNLSYSNFDGVLKIRIDDIDKNNKCFARFIYGSDGSCETQVGDQIQ